MTNLAEDPGITDGCPADHDAIDAIAVPVFERFFGGVDISVAEDRDMDLRVVLYFSNEGPVCLSFIELTAGAAVDGEGFNTCILQSQGDLFDVFAIVIPSQSGFDSDGERGCLYACGGESYHKIDVAENAGPCPIADDTFDGASEIDVQEVRTGRFDDGGRLCEAIFVSSEDLDGDRSFLIENIETAAGFYGIVDKGFAGDEFSIQQVCAIFLADGPEWRVADILHRGEGQREFGQHEIISNFYAHRCKNSILPYQAILPMYENTTPVRSGLSHRLSDLGFKYVCLLFPATMLYIILTDGDGCGDLPRDFKFFPIAGLSALVLALAWCVIDRQRRDYSRLRYGLQILTRYFLGFIILQYGFAKVLDMQFNPSLAGLDTRAVDMRPMTVAWTFFGYSFYYEFFIGISQILAGLLLVFRRTSTLGAILMVTIMANIVFVNFAFDVCVKFFSCTYLVMSIYLLIDDAKRLVNVLLLNKPAPARVYPVMFRTVRARRIFAIVSGLVLAVALAYPTYKTYASAKEYGVGNHTALYGVWTVDSVHSSRDSVNLLLNTDSAGWKKLLLEDFGNAAFKSWKNTRNRYYYKVDTAGRTLTLNSYYPDTVSFLKLNYFREKDTLLLHGLYNTDTVRMRMHLERKYFIRK